MNILRRVSFITITIAMLVASVFIIGTSVYANDDDYIEIRTIDDLYMVRNDLSANYRLMNDIDMSETNVEGSIYNYYGNGWDPIGSEGKYEKSAFTGTFDGNGYTIKALTINLREETMPSETPYTVYAGLFAYNEGTIKNLRIQDSTIYAERKGKSSGSTSTTAWVYAAPIAAINAGTIMNCSTSASCQAVSPGSYYVQGSYGATGSTYNLGTAYAGGICAQNAYSTDGLISNCYNESTVNASVYSGNTPCCGIASKGKVENCYNVGAVSPSNTNNSKKYDIGDGKNINCYTTRGNAIGGTATNCYYLYGVGQQQSGCIALNEESATKLRSYSGFDFENVWTIETATDYKYPQLRSNMMDSVKHVDTIEWESNPTKVEYYTDEDIDPTGGIITAYYMDDTHEEIEVTKDMLSGYDMGQIGAQTVTVKYREGVLTYNNITSVRPEVKSLTLETMPDKTEFARGTAFDFSGATAKVEYVNGKHDIIPIDADETTGGDITKSGTYTITFEKFGKSLTFDVKVVPVKPIGIFISSMPDKVSYIEGQSIETTGMIVKQEYNNGKIETVTDYIIEEYDNSVGKREITVSYDDFSTSFPVEFVEKSLTGIIVTTQPAKTKYLVGMEFDASGMVVKATYDNGTSEEITDYTVSSITESVGWQTLSVSYNGKTTTIKVLVVEKSLESISITKLPDKTTYIEGETFDPNGLEVIANYNDMLFEEVKDYTLTGANLNKVGKTTITVVFGGKTATFNVDVTEKTLLRIDVTQPAKTEYIDGEELDTDSMVVKAVYDNGKSEKVSDYTISGFGDSEETNIVTIDYKGKSYSFVVTIHVPETEWTITTPASCTSNGEKKLQCATCGKILQTEEIAAEGHKWNEWETVEAPSCTDKGAQMHSCSKCNEIEYKDVDPKGHSWSNDYTVDVEPSCSSEGQESRHCINCGVVYSDSIRSIDRLPHNYNSWVINKEATCAEAGIKQRDCRYCDYFETEEIPATGKHEYSGWSIMEEATCVEQGNKTKECAVCHRIETESIPAIGHSWGATTYTWSNDNKTVTATHTCKNDASHKETETVKTTSKVTKKATYTAKGQTTYTATFNNGAFKTQSKTLTNIAKLPKKANTITVKVKKPTVKFSVLKKKAQVITVKKAFTVSKAQGKVTYKKVNGNAKIAINSAGKITVKKGLKKGTYKVKTKVTAAGNTTYKAGAKTVTITIKVK